jgi:hypothetical protein
MRSFAILCTGLLATALLAAQGTPATTVFKDGIGYDSPRMIESVRGLVGIR